MQAETVLITGAARGIGLAVARSFSLAGSRVIGTSTTTEGIKRFSQIATEWGGGDVSGVVYDLSSSDTDDKFTTAVEKIAPVIDVVLCNAGIMIPGADISAQSIEQWDKVLAVNLTGSFRTIKAMLPLLQHARRPRVITMSGALGNVHDGMSGGGCVAYRVSKAGIAALTMTLAEEGRAIQLQACGFDPGWVRTDLGGPDATREPVDVALEIVRLATRMRDTGLTGVLIRGESVVPW